MNARDRYAAVLRSRFVVRLLVSAIVSRAPISVVGLATVLLIRDTSGSYASAGVVAAAFAVGAAIVGPLVGRLVDRVGPRRVLVTVAVVHAIALIALVLLAKAGASTAALTAISAVGGFTVSPLGSVLRSLWPALVAPELTTAAYALDSVAIEAAFVTGPLLVALAAAFGEPGIALFAAGSIGLAGTLAFVTCEPVSQFSPALHEHAASGLLGALRAPGVITVVVSILPVGFCIGAAEVAFPAFGEAVGDEALSGPLIALWSLGSAAGGLAYGAHGHRVSAATSYVRGVAALPLVTLPLCLAGSFAAMVPLALLAGLAIAPLIASANQVISDVAPQGARTEAFTWPITSLVAGVAAGNAASGAMVHAQDWRAAFLMAASVGIVGLFLVLSRRGTLGRPATT